MNKLTLNPGAYKGKYKLIGGKLCFDFTNTVSWRELEHPHEWLDSIDNLASWAQMAEILSTKEARNLKRLLFDQNEDGIKKLQQLKDTREIIYNIFNCVIHQTSPSEKDMKNINRLVKKAMSHLELVPSPDGFELAWQIDLSGMDKIHYSTIRSAVQVLTTKDLTRIKKCPSCQWLYLDMSKNKSRRWCTMEDCGNRHKVNAFNRHKKQQLKSKR